MSPRLFQRDVKPPKQYHLVDARRTRRDPPIFRRVLNLLNKYLVPVQGNREKERRLRQRERGIIR